ncbi:glutaredoxin family protein [Sandaracinus amylolyticus]|uniref:glutaredoxin family protein n=1 Tax=Sandaracinus amylolyticus TaxID=927083 RepID=UPI001F44E1D1|nr:glutaredoxin family protein [Sandaracinus amylolyticus]
MCRRSVAPPEPERETSWGRALAGIVMVAVMAILAFVTWPGADATDAQLASVIAREPEEAQPVVPVVAAPPPPAPSPPPRRPEPAAITRPREPRVIEATPPLDRHALAAARRRVSIVMYSTSWCGACRRARAFLDQLEGVSYVEHDIEADERARARMRALNPRGSIPTIDVEGRVFVGLSPSALEAAIDDAARRHM